MDAGTLYVAPAGTPKPDMGVLGGIFHRLWGPAWAVAVRCDISVNWSGTNFAQDVVEIDVLPASGPTGAFRDVMGLGVSFALGYESGDRKERYVFPVILGVESRARRNSPIGYRFTASRADVTLHAAVGPGWGPATPGQPFTAAGGSRPPAPVPARSAPYGGEAIDLVPGRLRGFREWKLVPGVDGASPRLASVTANVVWPWTPTVEAHCHRAAIVKGGRTAFTDIAPHDPAETPAATCSCGIYAKHSPPTDGGAGMVAGVIEAWGKVEVGTNGFRARYARLVALANTTRMGRRSGRFEPAATDEALTALAELYRVPTFNDPRQMWEKYPPIDVRSLLGQPPEPPPCPGCEANRRGDFAMHDPTCPLERGKSIHRNHVHISMHAGGPVTGGPTLGPVTWREIARMANGI